jgi:hypothetical protein
MTVRGLLDQLRAGTTTFEAVEAAFQKRRDWDSPHLPTSAELWRVVDAPPPGANSPEWIDLAPDLTREQRDRLWSAVVSNR